ncbi:MAG: sulfatase-like hydrolase/transferase [Planctomycetes bacterium]|nr:sulfatase-like hydrolase/transferase [Planctomycetota bacterium]
MKRRHALNSILLAAIGAWSPSAQLNTGTKPNILLIVLDDLGTEKLSFYGQSTSYPPTPRLAELREQGILFTHAYANPVCAATRAMLQTGRYTFRNGMGTNPGDLLTVNSDEVTIAEVLKAGFSGSPLSYRCGLFGKWHLSTTDREHACANGYDVFIGPMANNANHFYWRKVTDTPSTAATGVFVGDEKHGPFDTTTYDASVVRAAAVDWITEQTGPFFACVAFNPPHAPLQVPPLALLSASTQAQVALEGYEPGAIIPPSAPAEPGGPPPFLPDDVDAYNWMIEAVDAEIGRLLDEIPEEKRKFTMVFIVGDNGTHASVALPPLAGNHAKSTVYEGGTRVPLLVSGMGIRAVSATCDGLVSAVDLWATIAALANAQVGTVFPGGDCGDGVLDSLSFRHLLSDPAAASQRESALVQLFAPVGCYEPNPFVPAAKSTHNRGMTDGRFRYIRAWNAIASAYEEEAYDLALDPYETLDLFPNIDSLPPADHAAILSLQESTIELSGN